MWVHTHTHINPVIAQPGNNNNKPEKKKNKTTMEINKLNMFVFTYYISAQ